MTFGAITEPWWDDRDLYIVGGGDSLEGYDLSHLHEKGRVLGINRAPELIPCHACFTIDHNFLDHCHNTLAQWVQDGIEVAAATGDTWFNIHKPIPGALYLKRVQGVGLDEGPGTIVNGLNSGHVGLCYSILKRARRIYLLGFDLNGENTHWHDGYSWGCGRTKIYFPRWAKRFDEIRDALPDGCEVFNCNPNSAITAFQFTSYEEIGLRINPEGGAGGASEQCKQSTCRSRVNSR